MDGSHASGRDGRSGGDLPAVHGQLAVHLAKALGVHVRLRKRDEVALVAVGAEEMGSLGALLRDVPEEDHARAVL